MFLSGSSGTCFLKNKKLAMVAGTSPVPSHPSDVDIKGSSDMETDSQSSEFSSASDHHDSHADLEQDYQSSEQDQVLVVEPGTGSDTRSSSNNLEVSTDGQDSFHGGSTSSIDNQQIPVASSTLLGGDANGNGSLGMPSGDKPCDVRFRATNIDEVYLKPALGVEYESEEHAYLCYLKFSVDNGFSVRREFSYMNKKTGLFFWRKFCCYKQGWTKPSKSLANPNKVREGYTPRTGCLAYLKVTRQENGKFLVTEFTNEHNHEFVDASKAHLLPAQKRLAFAQAVEANVEQNPAPDGAPRLGMAFDSEDQAYEFYNAYAHKGGFYVRKEYAHKSRVDGTILQRKFSCCRVRGSKKDSLDSINKKPRKKSPNGCLAQMMISRQADGKYRVSQFVAVHNHDLFPDSMDGGSEKHNYDPVDYKNKLQNVRSRVMKDGEMEEMMDYFQAKKLRNPSFHYLVQADRENQVTNILWADAKMVVAYQDFGDVLCIDTSFRYRGDCRPFVVFYGVNHHKDLIIFGASLVYDESIESMTWVLQKFIDAMKGSKPQVVLTGLDSVLAQAVSSVMPESNHRVCSWHIYLCVLDHLSKIATCSDSFVTDVRRCIFSPEKEDFINRWKLMLQNYNLLDDRYLHKLYDEREKWAIPWGRHIFCADITNSQLGQNVLTKFWKFQKSRHSIVSFLNQLFKYINNWRYDEIEANYDMLQQLPNMMANTKMLKSAREVYTPKIFYIFQQEYEKSLNMVVNQCTESGESLKYKVSTYRESQKYTVEYKASDCTIQCECLQFEYLGVLCCHALKVLDYRNVKLLPAQYIMKRWTRDARGPVKLGKQPSGREASTHT